MFEDIVLTICTVWCSIYYKDIYSATIIHNVMTKIKFKDLWKTLSCLTKTAEPESRHYKVYYPGWWLENLTDVTVWSTVCTFGSFRNLPARWSFFLILDIVFKCFWQFADSNLLQWLRRWYLLSVSSKLAMQNRNLRYLIFTKQWNLGIPLQRIKNTAG